MVNNFLLRGKLGYMLITSRHASYDENVFKPLTWLILDKQLKKYIILQKFKYLLYETLEYRSEYCAAPPIRAFEFATSHIHGWVSYLYRILSHTGLMT